MWGATVSSARQVGGGGVGCLGEIRGSPFRFPRAARRGGAAVYDAPGHLRRRCGLLPGVVR
eukprot:6561980-Lingulodinium_polyedra.AAC.1